MISEEGKKRGVHESQQSMLMKMLAKARGEENKKAKFNGAPCAYFDGVYAYFNLHKS